MPRSRRTRRACRRNAAGLTLLETILAMAVLGGSIAAVGELVRLGAIAAIRARELSTAQVYCESKMNELASGMLPLSSSAPTPLEVDPGWLYAVEVQPVDQAGLMAVAVLIEKDLRYGGEPVSFQMQRWMVDLIAEEELKASEEAIFEPTNSGESASGM